MRKPGKLYAIRNADNEWFGTNGNDMLWIGSNTYSAYQVYVRRFTTKRLAQLAIEAHKLEGCRIVEL